MEKKRSPRSSKSPGPAIFPKSPLVYESYKSGCGWKLIKFFDFGHVKSGNKRLGSEKKKFIRDSAGNVYTKSQLDLLKKLHEKCQCNDRIVEEESSCKPKTRRRSLSSERELEKYESKPVQGLLEREIRRIKNLKEETCDVPDMQKQSSLSEIEKTNDKDNQIDLKNGRDCKKSAEINLQACVNEAAETFICSKAEEKGKDRSKQFMEALDILSSNKELFITLLQDPNSFSKKGQDLEGCKVKDPRDNSPSRDDDLDNIVLLKPRLSSSVDDKVYLRFKHLAKKLKLVVGSNKDSNHAENKPEGSGKGRETEAAAFRTSDVSTSTFGHRSPESPVFRRKKRVESDVFKLSIENDVLPRRFMVERQQERLNSSPVYEVPYQLSSLQTKLKERRQKLEKKRESFKLWSLDKNFEVFDPNPYNSNLRSLDGNCTGSAEYKSLRTLVEDGFVKDRCLESSLAESNSSLERQDCNIHDPKQEQEQPSPVSVLERIHLEDETVIPGNVKISNLEEKIGLSFDDSNIELVEKESVHEFVKKVLEASRLNWTNLMARCNEETSLLDEFSHGNHNDQLLLVLDYTDEILREIYRQDIKFWPFSPSKSSRVVNLQSSLREKDLIHETMRHFDWSLLCSDSPTRSLDQIIETDIIKPCLWLDFGGESEGVVSDIVEKIQQQLVLEISHELRTMQRSILCRLI
ncbi:unnamed protein product [Arabidopsis lyrata]|uniref:DUF3741 domain-containing protein n=1 Tax=Arabidopsis lyrata subsp. lyrata TaxID=81972 RepID=D7KTF2_ARALL|nr:uncharacterized protein LOC9324009 [Arabidopsis lyrata subsp. lyrata]XP_020890268.1 uncharacterized protein LOC9324009 [Arabidopsis lyrata subsp. lyrata]EFH62652.1 hypothetical protein ARALYDRAFT_474984 [Arabidopsis lyrata subsp. lyrata]CAH8255952.1 unnamed protein product [Arabidopsis lyrata]|eukprot:XP_020890267.1 uncharacterized protein LOC9324009 [Arabidopsis lyrata subsp. lyrata]